MVFEKIVPFYYFNYKINTLIYFSDHLGHKLRVLDLFVVKKTLTLLDYNYSTWFFANTGLRKGGTSTTSILHTQWKVPT